MLYSAMVQVVLTALTATAVAVALGGLRVRSPAVRGAAWALVPLRAIVPTSAFWPGEVAGPLRVLDTATVADAADLFVGVDASPVLAPILLAAWAVWSVIEMARLRMGRRTAWRIAASARPAPRRLETELEDLAGRLGIHRPITLRVSGQIESPFTVGSTRPLVVIPQRAVDGPPAGTTCALAHELVHVRNWDDALLTVGSLLRSLFPFDVALRIASREMQREAERRCDAEVLRLGIPAETYGLALLGLVPDPAVPWTPGLRGSGALAERVRDIASLGYGSHARWHLPATVAFGMMLLTILSWDPSGGWAQRYDIDVVLAASVFESARTAQLSPGVAFDLVRRESGFDSTAVSPTGAVGLTQVQLSTARILEPDVSFEELARSRTNLRIGLGYLARLRDEFRGDLDTALDAYVIGPAAARRRLTQ